MKKILIFGASGSGKSTMADTIGRKLSIPVYHLDSLSLDKNYTPLPREDTTKILQKILQEDTWIIDGQFKRLLYEERLRNADTIILLDIPLYISLWRSIRRFWMIEFKKEYRIGGVADGENRFSFKFLYWMIWRYPYSVRPGIPHDIKKYSTARLIILRSKKDIRDFFDSIDI